MLLSRPPHQGHLIAEFCAAAGGSLDAGIGQQSLPAGAVAGWGLHPLEKRRLVTAHVESGSFADAAARLSIAANKLRNRTTALRTRKGWRANRPYVPSGRGLVGPGGGRQFAVVGSACRAERQRGDEDTEEPSGDDFAAAR